MAQINATSLAETEQAVAQATAAITAMIAGVSRFTVNLEQSRVIKVRQAMDRGWDDLADVIRSQEGRMIVRAGLADELDWLNESRTSSNWGEVTAQ